MSLKLDKRMLLVLAVLMMLVVIPISFAQDVSDADVIGVNDDSGVDAVSESASDDVNMSTSDASSDVLGVDDNEIEITPNTASVSDYTPGESKLVSFSRNLGSGVYEDDFSYCENNLLLVVNDGEGIETTFSPTLSTIWLNLNTIPASSLHEGANTVKFAFTTGDTNYLEQFYTITSNAMTVNVAGSGGDSGEDDDGSIWVNGSYTGDTTDGKKATPYKTIADGINAASSGGTVKIAEGNYAINSAVTLRKNIDVVGFGDVNITGSNSYLFTANGVYTMTFTNINFVNINSGSAAVYYAKDQNKGTLKFINCSFTDNQAACLIFASTYVTLEGCNFIGNSFTGTTTTSGESILFNYYGGSIQYNVAYCMFIDNNIASGHFFHDWSNGASVIANNNYWGTNDKPAISSVFNNGASSTTLENWIVLDSGATDINEGDVVDLNIEFKSTTDGETFTELEKNLSDLTLTLQPTLGAVTPSVVTLSNNKATVTYNATAEGSESIVVKAGDATLGPIEFNVSESLAGKLFVDASYTGGDSDGSKAKPYTTISDALDNLGTNTQIVVFNGEYALNNYAINSDVIINGKEDNVIIAAAGAGHMTIAGGKTVNLTNLIFKGAASTSIVSSGILNISDCLFTENAGTNVISSSEGSVNVAYTVFNNNGVSGKIVDAVAGVVDYNFWDGNDASDVSSLALNNYVIVNATIPNMRENDELESELTYDINLKFVLNDGTELDKSLRNVTVTLTSTIGEVTQTVDIVDNEALAQFTSNDVGDGQIDVKLNGNNLKTFIFTVIERETGRIFVDASYEGDDSDGSKAKPFKTLTDAITKNNNDGGNQEIIIYAGTYSSSNGYYAISKNVNITARGKVIIDVKGYYFIGYSGQPYPDVVLNNLIITNGSRQSMFQYVKDLTLNNCVVANVSGGNNIVDSARGNIVISNSSFVNLKYAQNYNLFTLYTSSNAISISNSVFNNVTFKSGYYVLSGSSNRNIDGNFWGTNDPSKLFPSSVTLNNWAVAEATIAETIVQGQTPTLTVEMKLNNGDALSDVLPAFDLGLTSLLGNTFAPETITISNNIGSAVYTAATNGHEEINLTSGDNVVTSIERDIEEGDDPSKIFVDESYTGTDADGSKDKPFNNLKDAFDAITTIRNTVVVLEGNYAISDYTLSNPVTVRWSKKQVNITATDLVIASDVTFENLVLKDGNAITVNDGAKLTVTNTAFLNNAAGISSAGDLTISQSQFINTPNAISATAGTVNIDFTEFVLSDGISIASGVTGEINNNYWGTKPTDIGGAELTSWIELVFTPAQDEIDINASEKQTLTIAFKNTTDGSTFTDLAKDMPALDIAIEPAIGSLDKTSITLSDSDSMVYTATTEGAETINFKTEGSTFKTMEFNVGTSVAGKIFVNGSYAGAVKDGSRSTPFTDLDSAISAAQSGNEIIIYEGTYTNTGIYTVGYKDLTFTGVGEVILTRTVATSSSYGGGQLFTLNGYTYTFNNIIFANIDASNAYYSYGSVFYMNSYDTTTLNINNCTFANNTAQRGVIYLTNSYGKANINVQGTKFINNTASNGYLIEYNGGSGCRLTIANSAFVGNSYKNYLVYNKGSGYATINLNNNFWGSNELPSDATVASVMPTTWVIVEASMDADTITAGDTPNLVLTFKDNTGNDLSVVMPDVELDLSSVLNAIDATATISNNAAEVTYNAVNDGDEEITVKSGENVVATVPFNVEEADDPSVIFVDSQNGNNDNDGSKDYPVKDLSAALAKVTDTRNRISIKNGTYEITGTINNDITIYGKDTVTIKATDLIIAADVSVSNVIFDDGNKITVNAGNKLNVSEVTFANNAGAIESNGDLYVGYSKFLSNAAIDGKGVINILAGTVKIEYCEFVNCTDGSVIVYSDVAGDVNNNYWGSNEPNVSDALTADTWIKLDKTIDYVTLGKEYDLTISFVSNDGSDLTEIMPELDITLTPEIGGVDPANAVISDNKAVVKYDATTLGDEKIAVASEGSEIYSIEFLVDEDETGKVFVSDERGVDAAGYGSKATPYKTISYALSNLGTNKEIVVLEGTYTTSATYTINKNVIISGRGEVRLTRTGTGILFSISSTSSSGANTVTLNNLIIENVTAGSSSSGVIYYSGYSSGWGTYATTYLTNLNINNCTFNNNGGYAVIYGNQYENLNVTGSKFINNHPSNYVAYMSYYNHIDITQSIFYNNAVTSSYGNIIGTQQGTGTGPYCKVNYNIFIANGNRLASLLSGSNFDNNYYGTNNESEIGVSTSYRSNYVILEPAISSDDLVVGDSATVTLAFKDNNGNDLTGAMPTITLDLEKVLGDIDATAVMEDNAGSAAYTTVAQGDETITVKYGETALVTLEFYVDESPIGKIFVNGAYSGDDSDGSRNAPFKTITEAIAKNAELGGNKTIVIKAGEYTLSEAEITDNLTIKADDGAVINSEGKTTLTIKENANVTLINLYIYNAEDAIVAEENTKLDIIDSTFIGNDGVIVSNGTTTVYRTLFEDNDGTVIKAQKGSLDVSYSAFIGNDALIESEIAATANNNFWATNGQTVIPGVTIDNWVIVNATLPDAPDIFAGKTYDIEVKFLSNDGSELADTIPDVELNINSQYGIVESSVILSENEATVGFTTYEEGQDIIEFAVDDNVMVQIPINAVEDESGRIYVATPEDGGSDESGDGSKAKPYATITKALTDVTADKNEIVVFEGSYDTTTRYDITKNVQITGRGNVILTGEADNLFYLYGSYTLNLTGVTIDGFKSTSSYSKRMIYVYGSSYAHAKLNINDCTLSNNEATLVYIYYADANIQHSTIINNNAGSSYLFDGSTYGTSYGAYTINYSNIINNTNGYYAVYAYGNVNYNYWGTNDGNDLPDVYYGATRDNFVILTPSISSETIYVGDEYELTNVFTLNDGSDLEESMPDLAIDVSSDLGYADSFVISDNTGTTTFTAYDEGEGTIEFYTNGVKVGELAINAVNPLKVTVEKINEGEKLNITVNLITQDNGTAVVTVNNVNYPIELTNGIGSEIKETNLLPGTYNVSAAYGNYESTATTTINLREVNLTFEITEGLKVGDKATIKVIVSPATVSGDITVYVNGKPYTATKDNDYTFETDELTFEGEYSVVAFSNYDEYHNNGNNSTTFIVSSEIVDDYEIGIDIDNITVGDEGFAFITIPRDATGSVNITISQGSTVISTQNVTIDNDFGKYTIPNTLSEGTYDFTVKYYGNGKYVEKEFAKEFTVTPVNNITVIIDGVEYNITAVNGTTVKTNMSDALEEAIEKINNLTDKLTNVSDQLAEAQANLTAAEAKVANLTAQLVDAQANLTAAEAKVANLTAQLVDAQGNLTAAEAKVANLTAQLTNVSAQLVDAQGNLTAAEAKVANLTAQLADAQGNLTVDEAKIADLEAQLVDAQGNLTAAEAKVANLTAQLVDAQGNLTVDEAKIADLEAQLADAQGNLTAAEAKVANLTAQLAEAQKMIEELSFGTISTSISAKDLTINALNTGYVEITLKDANGTALANKTVKLIINGVVKEGITGNDGVAKIPVKYSAGTYYATVSFAGDEKYKSSIASSKIVVNKLATKITAPKKTFKAKIKAKKIKITLKSGKKAIKGKKITLKVKGKTYKAKTNKKGVATIKVTKLNKKGTFKYTVKFAGDNVYKAVSKKGKIKIK